MGSFTILHQPQKHHEAYSLPLHCPPLLVPRLNRPCPSPSGCCCRTRRLDSWPTRPDTHWRNRCCNPYHSPSCQKSSLFRRCCIRCCSRQVARTQRLRMEEFSVKISMTI